MKTITHLLCTAAVLFALSHGIDRAFAIGATTPFISYEAEAGTPGGGATIVYLTNSPTTQYSSPQLEASGHAYVALSGTGQSVSWVNNTGQNINAINLRSCIPDAPGGGGISSTIDLYVNGTFRQAFSVNSQQNYCYEGTNYNGQTDKNPADGDPRGFWNDTHAFITGAPIAPGSAFAFQKDAANSATFYYIDVVDLENVGAALSQPANSLSILSYGAVANNSSVDNTAAINNCFSAAQAQGKIAYIPQGTFYFSAVNGGLNASGITIVGAGPWYSTLYRVTPANNNQGVANIITTTSCTMSNLALDCNGNSRAGNNNNGAINFSGNNWVVDNVWIEHVTSSFWCAGNNGIARNCRTMSVWSDGGNFNNVQSANGIGMNLTYSNNFVRGTGDDAMAINSVNTNGSISYTIMSNIFYVNNTAIAPWGGKCIGIYGGINDVVTNNLLQDTARYVGLGVMRFGVNGSDLLSATVIGNTVTRCGGNGYLQQQPALFIGNGGDGQGVGNVENAFISGNIINNPLYGGVGYSTCSNIVLQNNVITAPTLCGIKIPSNVQGGGVLDGNIVSSMDSGNPMLFDDASDFDADTATTPASAPVEAASYNSESNIQTENCAEGGLDVGYISNGSYTAYTNLNLNGITSFTARIASVNSGSFNIVIHLDSPTGTVIGTCNFGGTGGWQTWQTVNCNVSGASGYHAVYLVYSGGFNIQWFAFLEAGNRTEAASYNSESNIQTENCAEGGLDVGYIGNGSYTVYNNVNLNGAAAFSARIASANSGSFNIVIHLDSPTGTVIGTCNFGGTGGWQNWQTASCILNGAGGYHNVYLVYGGGFNIQWFAFNGIIRGIEAASYNSENSVQTENCSEGGLDVGFISNGSYLEFANMNANGITGISARVASGGLGGTINIYLDSTNGTLIGTCAVPATGGWQNWTTVSANLSGATGYHNVYLVFNGGAGNLFNVEWFAFYPADGNRAEAASYNSESNTQTENCAEGGLDVGFIQNGSYLVFNQVNLTGLTSMDARVASGGPGGNIEVHLDSPTGTLVGTCAVPATAGWQSWTTVSCGLDSNATGYHNVYLVFTGGSGYLFNIQWFAFNGGFFPIPVSSYSGLSGGLSLENCSEGGQDLGNISNGNYAYFNNVDINGATSFSARVASAGSGGNIEVHLDSPTGTLIGTCTVPITGGWQTWTTQTCSLSGASGTHNIYLVFTGNGGGLFNVEWFIFQ